MIEILRRHARRLHHDDRGTTLMELIVGMAIMVVFMGMFTGAMLLMSNTTNKVEVISTTSAQTTNAFLRLDREIRYASAISTPAIDTGTGDWHVEFNTTVISRKDPSNPSNTNYYSSTSQCTQLRVDVTSQQLQQRTWTVSGSTYGNVSRWVPLASNVSNGSAPAGDPNAPFPAAAGTGSAYSGYQQLAVTLVTTTTSPTKATTTSKYTFTALNSSTSNNNATACQQLSVGATQ